MRIFGFLLLSLPMIVSAENIKLTSPDKRMEVHVNTDDQLMWSLKVDNKMVLSQSPIGLKTDSGKVLGKNCKAKETSRSINETFKTPFYRKQEVENNYNRLLLRDEENSTIEFRAYNDGVAYRFLTSFEDSTAITEDISEFVFHEDCDIYVPYINDNRGNDTYMFSFESYYEKSTLSKIHTDSLAITPFLYCMDDGYKVMLMDVDLENFAGMFLKKGEKPNSMVPVYAPCVLEGKIGGFNNLNFIPEKRADYIAKLKGECRLPWKAFVVARNDKELIETDMAQRLSAPCRIEDISWIKPGKAAWEWWNSCNLTGVSFKRGINTETYKYYIDFAAKNGLEYIVIDEGWSKNDTMMELMQNFELQTLIDYAKQKKIGIILWASWKNVAKEMNEAFSKYSAMGIKGFKIDFFDSDDHRMVSDMYAIAQKAAEYHLLLSFHGMKANGMQRTYPNILSFEGVKGLENNRWVKRSDIPEYECLLPFIRMQIGPMDYTPGGMRNANMSCFAPINDKPMTYGTRARQVALYTIFESPLQIVADSPTCYEKDEKTISFIKRIPTTFDETSVLDARLGEYILMARRKGKCWYISCITNWDAREMNIDLSFLPQEKYKAHIFADGINADFDATDYAVENVYIKKDKKLKIKLQSGGGWSAILTPM